MSHSYQMKEEQIQMALLGRTEIGIENNIPILLSNLLVINVFRMDLFKKMEKNKKSGQGGRNWGLDSELSVKIVK